jgi:hypothetical protein
MLLWQVPLFSDLAGRLPVLRVMTWARAGFVLPFALTVLGAIGAESWLVRRRPARLVFAAALLQGLLVVLLLTSPNRVAGRGAWRTVGVPVLTAGSLLVPGAPAGWLAATVITVEACLTTWPLVPVSQASRGEGIIARKLRCLIDDQDGRILGLGSALPANLAARLGAADVRAHDPVRPLSLARLHAALGVSGMDLPGPVTTPWAGLAGAWGVRWLVTPPDGVDGPAAAGWEEVYRGDDGRIYRNTRALPTVRLAGHVVRPPADPGIGGWEAVDFASTVVSSHDVEVSSGGVLTILELRAWRVRARTETAGPSMMVVHSPRAPGWQAHLDGRSAQILDANLGAMGVAIPAGKHEVSITYSPPGFWTGTVLTVMGLLGATAMLGRRHA